MAEQNDESGCFSSLVGTKLGPLSGSLNRWRSDLIARRARRGKLREIQPRQNGAGVAGFQVYGGLPRADLVVMASGCGDRVTAKRHELRQDK